MGELTALSSKIYVLLAVLPAGSCAEEYRTGGQPRSAHPHFRDYFIFRRVSEEAERLVVALVKKDAIQARVGLDTFLGQVCA